MRKRITAGLVLALLCIALPGSAANSYYHLTDSVTNTYGTAVSGARVNIYTVDTATTVTAYTTLAGGTAVTWPLTTDSNGEFSCYIAAGIYDINIVHSGWSISTTWDNYMVPLPSTPSTACVDTLKGCTDDTLHVRASDGARVGVVLTNKLVLEDALGHGGKDVDKAVIQYGRYEAGTQVMNARFYIPYYGLLWMTRPGYSARVPELDGVTYGGHNALGIGGDTGPATNWQFWEDVALTFTHPRGDSTAATGSRYVEKPVIEFGRKLRPLDSAYTGKDTLRCDAYQSLDISNDRGERSRWFWVPRGYAGSPPDTLHGARASPYGTPEYAIRLRTDLPDSNSAEGSREAVQIQWVMTPNSGEIRSANSSFLTMYEHNTENYVFCRDYLELRPSKEGSVNKGVRFYGSAGTPSSIKLADAETGLQMRITNGELDLYYAGTTGDSARIDANRAIFDYLTLVKWTGELPAVGRAQEFGDGTAFWRGADAEPATAQTLFIYSDGDSLYHYWESDGTVSP